MSQKATVKFGADLLRMFHRSEVMESDAMLTDEHPIPLGESWHQGPRMFRRQFWYGAQQDRFVVLREQDVASQHLLSELYLASGAEAILVEARRERSEAQKELAEARRLRNEVEATLAEVVPGRKRAATTTEFVVSHGLESALAMLKEIAEKEVGQDVRLVLRLAQDRESEGQQLIVAVSGASLTSIEKQVWRRFVGAYAAAIDPGAQRRITLVLGK